MNRIIVIAVALSSIVFAGCGSSSETTGNAKGEPRSNTALAKDPTTDTNISQVPSKVGNTDSIPVKTQNTVANSDSGNAKPALQFKTVDDDSEIATNMTEDGNVVQIRMWKTNKDIAKVESTWLGSTEKEVKIYLRSGKTATVKTDKIGDLKFANITELLSLAGAKVGESGDRPRIVGKKAATN